MSEGSVPGQPAGSSSKQISQVPQVEHDQQDRTAILAQVHAVEFTAYSGPIPPPDLLQRFDEIYPGAAQQILDDFVQESAHRRDMERKVVTAESFKEICGSIFAGLIGISGVGGGIWLAHEGRATGGLSSILATLASLVGVYLYQTRRADAEAGDRSMDRNSKGTQR